MKVLTMLVLASVLGMSSAVARADVPVVKKAPTAKTQAATTDGAPVKVSQQASQHTGCSFRFSRSMCLVVIS